VSGAASRRGGSTGGLATAGRSRWPPAARRVAGRVAALPATVHVLLVWALARAASAVVTVLVARSQVANGWTGARPGYLEYAGIWDGAWYRRIAEDGYPVPLPRDAAGVASQSEWAFLPAYPMVVRAVQALTGLGWEAAAPTTSLVLGAAAAVVVHRLFRVRAGPRPALAGVALLATFPSSPVTQYAYTESLALLSLSGALLLLVTRRYLACAVAVTLLGLTRPVGLPLAVVVLAHLAHRVRGPEPPGGRGLAGLLALAGWAAAAGLAWPVVTGVVHGDPTTYAQVQSAWRGGQVRWFIDWWFASRFFFGEVVGPVVVAAVVLALVTAVAGPWARPLGTEMRAWCLAYGAYLLAVVQPSTPVFRFWLLMVPLALLAALATRSWPRLVAWLAAHLALQVVWVSTLWHFTPPSDWPP
jgi:hypothetical protein